MYIGTRFLSPKNGKIKLLKNVLNIAAEKNKRQSSGHKAKLYVQSKTKSECSCGPISQ